MISAYGADKDVIIIATQQLEESKKKLKELNANIEKLKKSIQESSGKNPGDYLMSDVDSSHSNEITEEDINSVNLSEYKADLEQALEEENKRRESIIRNIQQSQAAKTTESVELAQELKSIEFSIELKKKNIEKITNVCITIINFFNKLYIKVLKLI